MKKRRLFNRLCSRSSGCNILSLVTGVGVMLTHATAQGVFTYAAPVDTVKKSGFYRIILETGFVSKSRFDLADIRLLGSDDHFVPYVLKEDARLYGNIETDPPFTQKDSSNKHSYIDIQFPEAYEIGLVAVSVKDPRFYKRKAHITVEGIDPGQWSFLTDVTIDPKDSVFEFSPVRTRRLRLDIANADNAPLTITHAVCARPTRYLLAYLQPGLSYRILTGNVQARAPEYDLGYFTDSIGTPPWLLTSSIRSVHYENPSPVAGTAVAKTRTGKDRSGVLLWTTIILALLLLLYLTIRMGRAVRQNDVDDRV